MSLVHGTRIFSELWPEVLRRGGLHPAAAQYAHVPGLFPPEFLSQLALPIGAERHGTQVVSLVHARNGRSEFDRQSGGAVEAEYERLPRTQIYENFQEWGEWPGFVVLKLIEKAKCQVRCRLFLSRPGDLAFDEHIDLWYGLVIQLRGVKRWWLRTNKDEELAQVVTRPGDLLILPEGVFHRAVTPEFVSDSLHVQFAVITREPLH
jgi:hypothetical protein